MYISIGNEGANVALCSSHRSQLSNNNKSHYRVCHLLAAVLPVRACPCVCMRTLAALNTRRAVRAPRVYDISSQYNIYLTRREMARNGMSKWRIRLNGQATASEHTASNGVLCCCFCFVLFFFISISEYLIIIRMHRTHGCLCYRRINPIFSYRTHGNGRV